VKERQKTKVVVLFSFEEQRRAKERKDLREITNEIENKRRALYYCTNQGSEITMSLFFTSLPLPVISFLPLDPESRVCDLRRVRRRGWGWGNLGRLPWKVIVLMRRGVSIVVKVRIRSRIQSWTTPIHINRHSLISLGGVERVKEENVRILRRMKPNRYTLSLRQLVSKRKGEWEGTYGEFPGFDR